VIQSVNTHQAVGAGVPTPAPLYVSRSRAAAAESQKTHYLIQHVDLFKKRLEGAGDQCRRPFLLRDRAEYFAKYGVDDFVDR